ncbi:MAG: nodulation protein NfeD [Candidatus Omnitrophica bacterium]|nr:nodulation protein NfeD [Candidatus Omnitrophota bacterium]
MKKISFFLSIIFICSAISIFVSADQPKAKIIDVIKIDNYIINPVIAKIISNSIQKAEEKKSICVVLQLDTPGGLLESTRNIVKDILNSKTPVVVYISPSGSRAGSAGVFITYASHIAAMAPSTNIGAAHPVGIGFTPKLPKKEGMESKEREEKPTDIMSDKIINDTVAWIKSIAESRNRNIKWAEDAVRKSVSITEVEALKKKVIEIIAVDLEDLVKKLNGRRVKTIYETITLDTKDASLNFIVPSRQERILNSIAHPFVAYILLMLGIMGLIFEFTSPGIGFPGIAGLICLLVAFFAFQLFPVNYLGIVLIILAFVLFIAEALTPTFGLLILGGLASLIFGSLLLMKTPHPFFHVSLTYILPVVLATAGISVFLIGNAIKTHRKKVMTGKEGLLNCEATTITKLNPEGKVFCHGEIWNASSLDNKKIDKKQKVKVVEIKGLKLIVSKAQTYGLRQNVGGR